MMSSEIIRAEQTAVHALATKAAPTYSEMEMLAKAMAQSGMFANAKDAAKALTLMVVGQELGVGPAASLMGINLINGKPSLSANLIAGRIKSSGRYDFRVLDLTPERCELAFYEHGTEIGRSAFSQSDAQAAGYSRNPQYKANPRNMLFARALSNGAKWYCPDVFSGVPVYHEGELEIAAGSAQAQSPQIAAQAPLPAPEPDDNRTGVLRDVWTLKQAKDWGVSIGMKRAQWDQFVTECEGRNLDVAAHAQECGDAGVTTWDQVLAYFDGEAPDPFDEDVELEVAA